MTYTKEELLTLGSTNLENARQKIVGLHIFDYIDDLDLSDHTLDLLQYTLELYEEYLQLLKTFSKTNLDKILKSLKNLEIIDNHSLERENPNLLHAYNETHHSTAITYLVKKLITEGGSLNDSIIIKAHEILMRGTSNQEKINKGFRNNNNTFVGYVENGQNVIQFYPISYNEINTAIKLFCTYFNSSYTSDFNFFVNPIISHGLLAALQVFNDGNT